MKNTVMVFNAGALDRQGKPNPFLLQELPWLLAHFDRVLLCSHLGVATLTDATPAHVTVTQPNFGKIRAALRVPFSRDFWREMARLHRDRRLNATNAAKLFAFALRGRMMANWARTLLQQDGQTTLYSFWMSYDAYAAALLKRRFPAMRAVARGHAFDIDIARNPMNPYLMKRMMVQTLDALHPISEDAKNRLLACVPVPPQKMQVLGMGSAGEPVATRFDAPFYQDGVFRIVSCSAVIALKQLPMLIDALAMWPLGRVRWLHLGGGADEAAVRAYAAQKLGANHALDFEITGTVTPQHVQTVYATQPFDVFVNTSASEGVPVSVMEAMRVGLPVIAPALGGLPELVTAETGILYPPEEGAQAVLYALTAMANLPKPRAQAMRQAAQTRWNEHCRSAVLLAKLFPDVHKEAQAR